MRATTTTQSELVLIVDRLCRQYGQSKVVDGVSFCTHRSEIVGLLGPNGAGKTTTINMILSVLKPTSGTITIGGRDVNTDRSAALERTGFAAVYAPLPGNLTVEQNLKVFGYAYRVIDLDNRISEVLAQFDLLELRKTKCGVLSSGEQARVCLAKAMINRPTLLLLDEPTASLDPASAKDIRTKIRRFCDSSQCSVLWTSHNMYEVEEVCDRVLFLSKGKLLLEGDPKQLPASHGHKNLEELFIHIASEPLTLTVQDLP